MCGDLCKTVCTLENLIISTAAFLAGTEQYLESSVYLLELIHDFSLLYIQSLCCRSSSNSNDVLGLSV